MPCLFTYYGGFYGVFQGSKNIKGYLWGPQSFIFGNVEVKPWQGDRAKRWPIGPRAARTHGVVATSDEAVVAWAATGTATTGE